MRDPRYQKLLNSKTWKNLRATYLMQHPLCERCKEQGRIRAAVDVHHKVPVETASSHGEMLNICYDWSNLQALCIPCHIEVHAEARSHSKEGHKQREADRLERWKERYDRRRGENPPTPDL